MDNQQFEFLDMLAIVSFALQMELMEHARSQATNNDVIMHLHNDITNVERKLDILIEHLGITFETS